MTTARRRAWLLTWAAVLGLAPGCGQALGTAIDSADAKAKAEEIAAEYFRLARAQSWTEIEALYDPRFYQAMPLETWRKILPNVERKLGPLQECSLAHWNVSKKVGTDLSGTVVSLRYACTHERYDATVSFSAFRPVGGERFRLLAQNFDSVGFLIE